MLLVSGVGSDDDADAFGITPVGESDLVFISGLASDGSEHHVMHAGLNPDVVDVHGFHGFNVTLGNSDDLFVCGCFPQHLCVLFGGHRDPPR